MTESLMELVYRWAAEQGLEDISPVPLHSDRVSVTEGGVLLSGRPMVEIARQADSALYVLYSEHAQGRGVVFFTVLPSGDAPD